MKNERIEPISDVGLLLFWLNQSGLAAMLDKHYPSHGNWQSPSVGKTIVIWLTYILSEGDHRQYTVEDWASTHLLVLRHLLEEPTLSAKQLSDDRLSLLLEYLSQDSKWEAFNTEHTQGMLQVYQLSNNAKAPQVVRLDSVIAGSFRKVDGLFQMGYSKQHRSDIPQIKVMLSTLDPFAMPISSYILAGNEADDNLYIPIIEKTRQILPSKGLLYVGDSKMGNLANRSFIEGSQNLYLMPLNLVQYPEVMVNTAIEIASADESNILLLYNDNSTKDKLVARIYELPARILQSETGDLTWMERLLLVQAPDAALRQQHQLKDHLEEACQTIVRRFEPSKGRHLFQTIEEAENFVKQTLQKHQCEALLTVQIHQNTEQINRKAYAGKPKCVETKLTFTVQILRNEQRIQQRLKQCGWSVYATNADKKVFDATQITKCYRHQYRIEQQFHHLLNKTTALTPIFLNLEHRIVAMIRLLLLALQMVSLMEHQIRTKLSEQKRKLNDLIPGNAGRDVQQPSMNLVLNRFACIAIAAVFLEQHNQLYAFCHGFCQIHLDILQLLDIPNEIYLNPSIYFKELSSA